MDPEHRDTVRFSPAPPGPREDQNPLWRRAHHTRVAALLDSPSIAYRFFDGRWQLDRRQATTSVMPRPESVSSICQDCCGAHRSPQNLPHLEAVSYPAIVPPPAVRLAAVSDASLPYAHCPCRWLRLSTVAPDRRVPRFHTAIWRYRFQSQPAHHYQHHQPPPNSHCIRLILAG